MKRFLVLLFSLFFVLPARAEWPDHPIRWIVPFGPGGANDLIARVAAEAVSKRLGQPVIIENRPGEVPWSAPRRSRSQRPTATPS